MTFFTFLPVLHCSFIDFDDPDYVTENHHVLTGLTAANVRWAWTTNAAGYYQPLSWLSLMLDTSLTGTGPEGYHRTNLLIHAFSAGVVFLVLSRMTGTLWRAALIAAIYAVHPLRVESVAWVAERKDVLSDLLAWLAVGAYVGYARSPHPWRYLLVFVLMVMGVLAKPMIVTLPLLLLLLDYWPLGRRGFGKLLWEKIPLLAVSLMAGAAAIVAQRNHAMVSVSQYPPVARLGNAAIGYVLYLRNMTWFSDLAVLYPLPLHWPWPRVVAAIGAAALLAAITLFSFAQRKQRPWLMVGWLWFVGVLFPVSGIFQAGDQMLADRFSYLPCVGLLVMLVWSIPEWVRARGVYATAAVLVLAGLSAATWRQCGYWRNSRTLFERDLAVTQDNWVAHDQIGLCLYRDGNMAGAMKECRQALAINPLDPVANFNMGLAMAKQGQRQQAIDHFHTVLKIRPDLCQVHNALALELQRVGDLQDAYDEYRAALDLDPDFEPAHVDLAGLLSQIGMVDKAADELRVACRLDPLDKQARMNLAAVLAYMRRQSAAAGGGGITNDE
jgi:tetratricopeptide (TPR) repeat protein